MSPELAVVKSGERTMRKPNKFLRMREVMAMTALSRSTIFRRIAKGDFPAAIQISEHRVGWSEAALTEWMHERERLSGARKLA